MKFMKECAEVTRCARRFPPRFVRIRFEIEMLNHQALRACTSSAPFSVIQKFVIFLVCSNIELNRCNPKRYAVLISFSYFVDSFFFYLHFHLVIFEPSESK